MRQLPTHCYSVPIRHWARFQSLHSQKLITFYLSGETTGSDCPLACWPAVSNCCCQLD